MDNYNINSKNVKDYNRINRHNYKYKDENEDFDEKIEIKKCDIIEREKNPSINFVNKCFDFNNDIDIDIDSNDIADEYLKFFIIYLFIFFLSGSAKRRKLIKSII